MHSVGSVELHVLGTYSMNISFSTEVHSLNLHCKAGCIFPLVISCEFRMTQYRDDDHREDAPQFTFNRVTSGPCYMVVKQFF